jgi:ethanolamine ammonia-lyase large subunit
MAPYQTTLRGEHFHFADLREVFARANEEKSGDQLAGVAARSERERVAAKIVLADVPLGHIVDRPLIDPDEDDVSRLLLDTLDVDGFDPLRSLTVGQFRELLLDDATGEEQMRALSWSITPEIAAAAAKLMSNKDLILAASKVRNVTRCRNTLGERGVLAVRLQPNHPSDDLGGILLAAVDGLLFGSGDAVIGVNPATDSLDKYIELARFLDRLRERLDFPGQSCVLAHVTTALAAIQRGAPVDLVFQSIAGSEAANRNFGIDLALLHEAHAAGLALGRGTLGNNVMYFETGQGSALSAEAHHRVDQQTMEARAYAVARAF